MSRNSVLLFLSLLVIFLVGLIHLSYPFYGDEAFFLLGARELNDGAVLYIDFWDIKQPGIFYFYFFAGELFGFNEIGIHLFELMNWLIFSIALIWFLNRYIFLESFLFSCYSAVLLVVTYYIFAGAGKLTQVEALVNMPLLGVVIFNTLFLKELKYSWLWLFLSGIFGGIVLFYKLIFLPIICVLWLVTYIRRINKPSEILPQFFLFLLIPFGVIIFWLPFLLISWQKDMLSLVYTTFFVIPPEVVKHFGHKPIQHLLDAILNFFPRVFIYLFLSIWCVVKYYKSPFVRDMLLWFLTAFFVVIIQLTSWVGYQFQLLYTPIIMLSSFLLYKLDTKYLKNSFSFLRIIKIEYMKATILIIINLPLLLILFYKLSVLEKYNFAIRENDRKSYILENTDNLKAFKNVQPILPLDGVKGDIFVAGDPLIYHYSDRLQATAYNGWGFEFYYPEQWSILFSQLQSSRPIFIYMDRYNDPFFIENGKQILNWINLEYILFSSNENGRWFKLKQ